MNKQLPQGLDLKNVPPLSKSVITTEIVEPIVQSSATGSMVRWVLLKKGILDVNSLIQLGVKSNRSEVSELFFPIGTNAYSMVDRCRLKIGNNIIQSVDDFAYLGGYLDKFKGAEERSLKDFTKIGCIDVLSPSLATDGLLSLKDMNVLTTGTGSIPDPLKITNLDDTTFLAGFRLNQLFSILRTFSPPLFALDEEMVIEIDLKPQATGATDLGKVCCVGNTDKDKDTGVSYSLINTLLLVDYVNFSEEIMNDISRQIYSEKGLSVAFQDILLYNSNVSSVVVSGDVLSQTDNTELGLADQDVNWVCMMEREADIDDEVMGRYRAQSHPAPTQVNMRVDDRQYLPRPVVRESEKFNYVSQVYNRPLQVHNAQYSQDAVVNKLATNNHLGSTGAYPVNQTLITGTYAGRNLAGLQGNFHYLAFDMTRDRFSRMPTRLGKKPIQFERTLTRTQVDNKALEQRFYASVMKQMTLRNGRVSVSA